MDRRKFIILPVAAGLSACSRPVDLMGADNAAVPTSELNKLKRHRILIATNRSRSDDPAEMFSERRSARLRFAVVDVTIPPDHVPGQVEWPRSATPDPRKHFSVRRAKILGDTEDFRSLLSAELSSRPPGRRNALIFVHGYRQTFTAAILNLAQFLEDSGYDGVPVLFAWPSSGRSFDYLYDLNSALISRRAFLRLTTSKAVPALESYEIFAHSMGNVIVMEALRHGGLSGDQKYRSKLNGIVLASPDIDLDLFAEQLSTIPLKNRNFVVLTSRDDAALRLSQRLSGGRVRVGRADPELLIRLGVSVIDLSAVDDETSVHHSKFEQSPELVRLIGSRILDGDQFGRPSNISVGQAISLGVDDTISVFGSVFGN